MAEQAEFNQRFQSQATKLGLGHGSFSNNPTPDERRKQVSRAYAIAAEEKRIAHATTSIKEIGPPSKMACSVSTSAGTTLSTALAQK
ncbi:MAG: hypothetical protein ACK53L_30420 [Pirellulaceae bacterium]